MLASWFLPAFYFGPTVYSYQSIVSSLHCSMCATRHTCADRGAPVQKTRQARVHILMSQKYCCHNLLMHSQG